jgi:hypothetical protein
MAQNLDHVEFTDFLIKLSKDRALGNHCAIVIMILSHGTEKQEFLSFDGKPIKIEYLFNLFNNENCRYLLDKPRIFIFNFCRGSESVKFFFIKLIIFSFNKKDKDDFGITVFGNAREIETPNISQEASLNVNNNELIHSLSNSESGLNSHGFLVLVIEKRCQEHFGNRNLMIITNATQLLKVIVFLELKKFDELN